MERRDSIDIWMWKKPSSGLDSNANKKKRRSTENGDARKEKKIGTGQE